jgi:hypothetical protein
MSAALPNSVRAYIEDPTPERLLGLKYLLEECDDQPDITFEALIIAASGVAMLAGKFREDERERLILAVSRFQDWILQHGNRS